MRRIVLSLVFAVLSSASVYAQSTPQQALTGTPVPTSDPRAVALVQAAINALGGATAISPLQSWTFQGQAAGRAASGPITEALAASVPRNTSQPSGTQAKAPPPWARPRSLLVPALVGAILANESKDPHFLLEQGVASASAPSNTVVVAFFVITKTGTRLPAQKWYFDQTTSLPNRVEFLVPPKVGPIEGFPGTVTLSNYQTVGGVLYPFQIVTLLQRDRAMQRITLQSLTPSTTLPSAANAPAGGAQ